MKISVLWSNALAASYGVCFVNILEKIDHVIMAPNWIWLRYCFLSHCVMCYTSWCCGNIDGELSQYVADGLVI